MGSIGHELRHTLEVIDLPAIRTDNDKSFFYEQIGTHGTSSGAPFYFSNRCQFSARVPASIGETRYRGIPAAWGPRRMTSC
jgi:hypothetical protein